MCNLNQQKFFKVPDGQSRQRISSLDKNHSALVKKNNDRALAILRALAPYQTISSTSDLSKYPTLKAALDARKAT